MSFPGPLERQWLRSANRLSTLTFAPSQGALAVPEILSVLLSSRLSTLTIVLEEDEDVLWEATLDQALSHQKFETLECYVLKDARAVLKARFLY